MSAADPFLPDKSAAFDEFTVRKPIVFPKEDGVNIMGISPSWYDPNCHVNGRVAVVTMGGAEIHPGFTVAEVVPWRRWAIQPETENDGKWTAEVLPQLDFEQAHERHYRDTFKTLGGTMGDPSKRSVPRVERFVSVRRDLMNLDRTEPITRAPNVKRRHRKPLVQFDADGLDPKPAVEDDGAGGFQLVEGTKGEFEAAIAAARATIESRAGEEAESTGPSEEAQAAVLASREGKTETRCGMWVEKKQKGAHAKHCESCIQLKAQADAGTSIQDTT